MKLALSFAWYLIQFLRLIFSTAIVLLGVLLIFTQKFWLLNEQYPWNEKLVYLGVFVFVVLALIASNRLVNTLNNLKNNIVFTTQNKTAFQFAAITAGSYLVGKYVLLLYLHPIDKLNVSWHIITWQVWKNNDVIQISEVISVGLLACFFWIIAQLINEGINYKTENDLTI